MKTLPLQKATSEQLPIVQNTKPGVALIRGAAGSGKTTTALLRLRQLTGFWLHRRNRLGLVPQVRVLVITYNRTLRGYVSELAGAQVGAQNHLELQVTTFAKLATDILPNAILLEAGTRSAKLHTLCNPLPLPTSFLVREVEYAVSRFQPDDIDEYVSCERTGRGSAPMVRRKLRERIIEEIIRPFQQWKEGLGRHDWNDLAIQVADLDPAPKFDIIVVDESQDLSANEVRGIMNLAADPSSVTFILDTAQSIYPKGFTWREVDISINPTDIYRLEKNHRNTIEICQFARPLISDMDVGDDGTLPNLNSCERRGEKPIVLKGRYSKQVAYAIRYIRNNVDLTKESVAFLKPLGGGWFDQLKSQLTANSLGCVEISRQSEWPIGPVNIALSTMHSAKGLEFDHVIILGLNAEVTPYDDVDDDEDKEDNDSENRLRRLLAMAITRARNSVIVGYKPGEASDLITHLARETYTEVTL